MRISCNDYDKLMAILTDASFVIEDPMTKEEARNIVFKLEKGDSVTGHVIGYNNIVTFKQVLSKEFFDITLEDSDNDIVLFQIKSKVLLGFLNTYKNLRRTYVNEVIFEFTPTGALKCTVIEKDKADEDSMFEDDTVKEYVSQKVFKLRPVANNQLEQINMTAPSAELITIPCLNLLFHIKNLAGLLQQGTNIYSMLQFDNDYVVVVNPSFTVTMQNNVQDGDIFKGISIYYKGISFLNRLCLPLDSIEVSKDQNHVYIKTENTESFIRYSTQISNYNMFLEAFKHNENGLAFDKLYFKDVIRRLSLEDETVEFGVDVENNMLTLSNSSFNQEMPAIKMKNMEVFSTTKFKIMPDIFNQVLIGDESFDDTTFIYYYKSDNSKLVFFTDATRDWFAVARVNMYEVK